jgi:hypothetical protein
MAEAEKPKSGWPWLTILLCSLPVFYVLSIGPVARFVCHRQNPEWVTTFYAPLIWLCDNTPLSKPIELYLELWL